MDVLVGKTERFSPSYDSQYRFKTPRTFDYRRKIFRPHTSEGNFVKSKGEKQLELIAHAQESPVEAFHRSLEESLMIIRPGHTHIHPSHLTNLDQVHIFNLKQDRSNRRLEQSRPWTTDERFHAARGRLWNSTASSRGIRTVNATHERSDELKKSFVEFIAKSDPRRRPTSDNRSYRHHPEYLSDNRGEEDRCQRCASHPQIQIDGRTIGGKTPGGSMSRQYCDVLGVTMCPDCRRTRARNEHFRKYSASVSQQEIEVYRMAFIRQRIPTVVFPRTKYHSRPHEPKVISVSSLDTTGKHVTRVSIEATEKKEVHDDCVHLADDTLQNNMDLEEANDEKQHDPLKENNPELDETPARVEAIQKSKSFNRGLVPSPDYFSNIIDLQHRIRAHRKSRRSHFLEIEALAEEIHTKQKEDEAKMEEEPSQLDPQSPRIDSSAKIYEPPILFGQRPMVLGVNAD